MQLLPGFRDFYPDDCARRNYILATWREVCRRYGFVEYDAPVLEPINLYQKKSGGELVGQLFDFTDKGERHIALRPELTPSLARMVAAREREFKKPLKWFSVPQCFRYEKPQRGRGREFYQLNADIIGEASPAADAELIALSIDVLRAFGLTGDDFQVRLSDRAAWENFLANKGVAPERLVDFLAIVDKLERMDAAKLESQLADFNCPLAEVRAFATSGSISASAALQTVVADLQARGLTNVVVDLTIVRGLAYYTGVVFELFDAKLKERALAGGGRYDGLLALMSDGKVNLPALGFGMGDVVLANLIDDTPAAKAKLDAWLVQNRAAEVYVVIAKEELRAEALALVQKLRDAGQRVDFPLASAKVGKQFQAAEQLGASHAIVVGDEWPQVKLKTLATRAEQTVPVEKVLEQLGATVG